MQSARLPTFFLFATTFLAATTPCSAQIGLAPADAQSVVSVQAYFTTPAGNQPGYLVVTAEMKPGWHIYSITQPSGGPIATKIKVAPTSGVELIGPFQPSTAPHQGTEPDAFGDLMIESHEGKIAWFAPIKIAQDIDPAGLTIPGSVTVQPCDANACLPPQDMPFAAKLALGQEDSPISVENKTGTGRGLSQFSRSENGTVPFGNAIPVNMRTLWTHLALAFLGGIILNVMPCVLPVISLKLLAFLEQGGESRGRVFLLNLWYSVGLLSVFMLLAALAASFHLAWGEQFTLPWFKVAMTAFVFVMALSFLGVWEIPIPGFVGSGRASQLQTKEGPSGAFFKGVFTTILATPCSGPFLGPVFGYLLKQPPYVAYLIFGSVGLGMASPYLVIGALPELIRFLPRPGAWMETVKQVMGFLLLATVVYLFNTLSPSYFIPTLTLLVGLWFACWWIGRTPLTASASKRWTAWCGGLGVAALAGVFAFNTLMAAPKIPWQPFSPAALEAARAEGKTVMIDFTANWCPNCKLNSKFAIETEAVSELVRRNRVVPLLADWTDHSPVIKKALNDLGANSIPFLAIYPAQPTDGEEVIRLPDVLRESDVLSALERAGPSR